MTIARWHVSRLNRMDGPHSYYYSWTHVVCHSNEFSYYVIYCKNIVLTSFKQKIKTIEYLKWKHISLNWYDVGDVNYNDDDDCNAMTMTTIKKDDKNYRWQWGSGPDLDSGSPEAKQLVGPHQGSLPRQNYKNMKLSLPYPPMERGSGRITFGKFWNCALPTP